MERTSTTGLAAKVGERVRIAGWLHSYRQLGRIGFAVVRDGRGTAQIVFSEKLDLVAETVLEVDGTVVEAAQAPDGVELHEPTVRVISRPAEPPPIELRRPELKEQLPTLLDHAAVSLRHPRVRDRFRVAAAATAGFRRALDRLGFTEINTPKVVASATEGGANVFPLDWFGRPAYLAQSPQFYKQTMVGVFERVYEVGPVFRAEPHDTGRHLAEYVSLDAELGFVDDHRDVMRVARAAVAGMIDAIRERTPGVVELPAVPDEIPVLHFAETGVDDVDLAPADERRLGELALREHGSDFVFVEGFPAAKRPFYTHPEPGRPEFTNSFDLIFRGLEIVTGGQRLHRYEDYLAALAARGLDREPFEGYLEAFRHGMPPHGGFALGLERFVARLVGAANIRETTLFPRDRGRLTP
jgi:nondiscriminating aspartyl-tRNA synthetase